MNNKVIFAITPGGRHRGCAGRRVVQRMRRVGVERGDCGPLKRGIKFEGFETAAISVLGNAGVARAACLDFDKARYFLHLFFSFFSSLPDFMLFRVVPPTCEIRWGKKSGGHAIVHGKRNITKHDPEINAGTASLGES